MQFIVPLLSIFIFIVNYGDATVCPNEKVSCPGSLTCCMMYDGTYGCCPFQHGVCCSDERTCCPQGTKCDMQAKACVGQSLEIPFPWMVQVYAHEVVQEGVVVSDTEQGHETKTENEVAIHIDDKQECPDGNSCLKPAVCCQMPKGNYGCCPFPKGNCCSDKEHCCPDNYNCDLKHGRCIPKSTHSLDSLFLNLIQDHEQYLPIFNYVTDEFETPKSEVGVDAVATDPCNNPLCPFFGGHCCKNSYGGILDFCCPIGTSCSHMSNTCFDENAVEVPAIDIISESNIFESVEQTPVEVASPDIVCPDKSQVCSSYATCCPYAKGGYACCPSAEATCCADKLHCCPNGYVCTGTGCVRKPALYFLEHPKIIEKTALQVPSVTDDNSHHFFKY